MGQRHENGERRQSQQPARGFAGLRWRNPAVEKCAADDRCEQRKIQDAGQPQWKTQRLVGKVAAGLLVCLPKRKRHRSADRMAILRGHTPAQRAGAGGDASGHVDDQRLLFLPIGIQWRDLASRIQQPQRQRRDLFAEVQPDLRRRRAEHGAVGGLGIDQRRMRESGLGPEPGNRNQQQNGKNSQRFGTMVRNGAGW